MPKFTPVDHLAQVLDTDMRAVNALILERMQSPVTLIPQLATYLIAAGGKRIRPLLTLAATQMFGGDMGLACKLAASVEFIHTATLLHDDVVDESLERRGQKTANLVFGNQASVLVGDFLFSRAFQLMTECHSIPVLRILSESSAIIAQGEVLQLSTAHQLDTPMETYLEVIKAKTAALFSAACEVGPVIAGADDTASAHMAAYGLNMGIAFQIADDTLDYTAEQSTLGKTVGDDFREGKLTAPVLFALKNADEAERDFWRRTMGEREQTPHDLPRAQEILKKHDAIAQSMTLAERYAARAREALSGAPDSPLRDTLEDLVAYTITRAF